MNAGDLMEKIMAEAPSVQLGGASYFIVERDRKVREDQLMAYCEELVAGIDPAPGGPAVSERLVVATVNERRMRWQAPTRLTWTIDEASFEEHPEWLQKAREICPAAAGDWNAAAGEQGVADRISFAPATTDEEPVFRFACNPFPGQPGLLALAFFPNDPPEQRVVWIGPGTFEDDIPYDRVGIIRHELGHVLGFRHEHIRPEAQAGLTAAQKEKMEKWVTGGLGGEVLSQFDGQSVMHYPLNDFGTLDFELSDLDKKGFGLLYRLDRSEVREFSV